MAITIYWSALVHAMFPIFKKIATGTHCICSAVNEYGGHTVQYSIPTLLQARWSAVFFTASCRVRSAFALLTSSSKERVRGKSRGKKKQPKLILYSTDYFAQWYFRAQWISYSYQQHLSGHFQQPSWVGFSLQHQHCWPEHCGSAGAEDTPHGQ